MGTINQLPKDWKWVKLGEGCSVIMGQSPPSTSYNTNRKGLPFFQGKAEFTDLYPIVEKWCDTPKKIAEPNDILLSVRAPVGTTNIADQKCCIGRGLAAIRFENYKYVFYFLRSIQQELDSKGTGTTFRAISGEIIRETLFPLPPKPIQLAIVSKIEELFSEIEKGIESLFTAQQQLKTYRQSVLKSAFEGKLTNENVQDGELPKGWGLTNLNELCSKKRGISYGVIKLGQHDETGIPCLRTSDVRSLYFDLKSLKKISGQLSNEYKRTILHGGEVLLNIRGTLGGVSVVPQYMKGWNISREIALLPIKENVNPQFVAFQIASPNCQLEIQKVLKGIAYLGINLSEVRNLKFRIPSMEEQNKIVQEIESRLSVADKMEESINQSLQQAEALKQSILKKAFEGKLI